MLHNHLNDEYETLLTHSEVHDWREVAVLEQNVDRVWIGECCELRRGPLENLSIPRSMFGTSSLDSFDEQLSRLKLYLSPPSRYSCTSTSLLQHRT